MKTEMNAQTKLNAVIGYPLEHSLSPTFHNGVYQEHGLNAVMLAFPNPNLSELIASLRILDVSLCAVTMPHKESLMQYLDEIDEFALELGAVNTIIRVGDKLKGYNTDYVGIDYALKNEDLAGKNVLVLGAGGAARAVLHYLRARGACIYIKNRDMEKARNLAENYGALPCEKVPENCVLIVNATPLGLKENDAPPLSKEEIPHGIAIFDMIYKGSFGTLFQTYGSRKILGAAMFVGQACEQIRLWSGIELDTDAEFSKFTQTQDLKYKI